MLFETTSNAMSVTQNKYKQQLSQTLFTPTEQTNPVPKAHEQDTNK
jgi:hypothetical protein